MVRLQMYRKLEYLSAPRYKIGVSKMHRHTMPRPGIQRIQDGRRLYLHFIYVYASITLYNKGTYQ